MSNPLVRATKKIAPLWPLEHFVAVNPFLGLSDMPFAAAARTLRAVSGARMTMPRRFYLDAVDEGRITEADLAAALAESDAPSLPRSVTALLALARAGETREAAVVPTVADVTAHVTGRDWSRFVTERISAWASSYFDEGQASWTSPFRDLAPYAAWREEARIDRTPEAAGIPRFRALVADLPDDPRALSDHALASLGVPAAGVDLYLHRLVMTTAGWSAWARRRGFAAELAGGADDTLSELLAIRLAWEVILRRAFPGVERAWSQAKAQIAQKPDVELEIDLVLHAALERAFQRELVAKLSSPRSAPREGQRSVQAVFCIDVRSEVFRRALESVDADVETIGFAGFFGFALDWVPFGRARGGARCPVLLSPKLVAHETVHGTSDEEEARLRDGRLSRLRASEAWRSFKTSAVACFGFVGPVGLAYARKLVTDTLGLSRPVEAPAAAALDAAVHARLGPRMDRIPHGDKLATARGVLRAMSLTERFARVVLLVGHGASTVNNAHATALDCGACGGHAGDANARVATAVLNDREVRRALASEGIVVPDDTLFVAALHDTTTDEVTLFDLHAVPASHADDLARLGDRLREAARLARRERARKLDLDGAADIDAAVVARSRDWSQVRPEWGLAGCAAFVAAPRHRTEGLDLGGRAFLHSYDWRNDEDFAVLELIMTAPVVVASWISLQYYGSTVDNGVFGCGNKTLHNVVGTLGVLEGNGGDLRVGLPWQSVHDGTRFVHEPVRLNVVVLAPLAAMNAVLAKHEAVRQLVDHGWLHLHAMDDAGRITHRRVGGGWEPLLGERPRAAA